MLSGNYTLVVMVFTYMMVRLHTHLAKNYLTQAFGRYGFANEKQWPPKSPNLNPLDYWFWNSLKEKVYEGRREPFRSVLKRRVKRVRAVMDAQGGPISHKLR